MRTFGELLDDARGGSEVGMSHFYAGLPDHAGDQMVLLWAIGVLIIQQPVLRVPAAAAVAHTVLGLPIDERRTRLLGVMSNDPDQYVRRWLATAFYKIDPIQKIDNRNPEVLALFGEACKQQGPLGRYARKLRKQLA